MDNSSAERLDSSSRIECKPLVHLFCSSMTLLAMEFVLIFIRKGVVCKALETHFLFVLQLEYQVPFEAPNSRKM